MGKEVIQQAPTTAPSTNGKTVPVSATVDILLTDIKPSSLTPQKNRRARFDPEKLKELAASIAQKGVISPITVRFIKDGFELVAGERRWIASGMAGAKTITAVVREISDQDAAEIQLLENLQREDVHPLDEATSYKYLHEKLKIDIAEIALKVGKTEKHVLGRLKLNSLTAAAFKMLNAAELPIGHAMEMAKYPVESQKVILKNCLTNWSGTVSLKQFRDNIERTVQLKLSKASFSLKATNLLPSGLACVDCPERTGANPTLFDEADAKDDRCLNQACYGKKVDMFVQITRTEVTSAAIRAGKPEGYEAPLVRPHSYGRDNKYPKALNYYDAEFFTAKKDTCDYAETGVIPDGDRAGQKTLFCRDKSCKKHKISSSSSSSSSTGEKSEGEKEKFRQRKEEIWTIKVREAVRRTVLKEAAVAFSQTFVITGKKIDLLPNLVGRMWDLCEGDTLLQLVKPLMVEMFGSEKEKIVYSTNKLSDMTARFRDNLTGIEQAQLLFLLTHGAENAMYYNYSYKSQFYIQRLAEEFSIDYRLADAKQRVVFSPKKHMAKHTDYLAAVEKGNKAAQIPVIYAEKYEIKDPK
jgi:ParB family chromosome partitioning protein